MTDEDIDTVHDLIAGFVDSGCDDEAKVLEEFLKEREQHIKRIDDLTNALGSCIIKVIKLQTLLSLATMEDE